jgi:hypothetical protein
MTRGVMGVCGLIRRQIGMAGLPPAIRKSMRCFSDLWEKLLGTN